MLFMSVAASSRHLFLDAVGTYGHHVISPNSLMQLVIVMAVSAAVIATAMTFRFISQIFLLFIATDFYFFTFSLFPFSLVCLY